MKGREGIVVSGHIHSFCESAGGAFVRRVVATQSWRIALAN